VGKKLSGKQIKVLYVCPFAHYSGHPPWAAIHEPDALARAGADVTLLTFYGIVDNTEVKVPHITVIPRTKRLSPTQRLVNLFLTRWSLLRWPSMFLENLWVLSKAVRLKRKLNYDIIHLRDGDPFLPIPFLISLPEGNSNWVISLMGGGLYKPPRLFATLRKDFRLFVYEMALRIIHSKLWRPLYRRSLAKNRFLILTQSEAGRQRYDSYMQGIFSGRVTYLMMGQGDMDKSVSKEEARRHLGMPQDKPIFLSFGVPHPGKDLETVFCAVKGIPNIILVQAGKSTFSVGPNPTRLAENYAIVDKVIIRDNYISEKEKPYYFFAADAVILSYTKQFLSTVSVLWDACHFRTPVIASDNGQLGELVQAFRVGLLFKAQDAISLKDAISRFTSLKPDEIEALKKNCQKFSDEFSIGKWAQGCLEIYKGLLSDKRENSAT
jgi:glycosyltransferase involved in cell wall biosynthesis